LNSGLCHDEISLYLCGPGEETRGAGAGAGAGEIIRGSGDRSDLVSERPSDGAGRATGDA